MTWSETNEAIYKFGIFDSQDFYFVNFDSYLPEHSATSLLQDSCAALPENRGLWPELQQVEQNRPGQALVAWQRLANRLVVLALVDCGPVSLALEVVEPF